MNILNWKLFNKAGSNLHWSPDAHLPLTFSGAGKNAEGFLITDVSGKISAAEITNSGYKYDATTTASYIHTFTNNTVTFTPAEVSINLKDVSIFAPEPMASKGIGSLTLDVSTIYEYPSVVYTAAVFLKPVSQGLVETEHLFVLEQIANNQFIRPYDASNYTLICQMIGNESEIQLFEVDEHTQEITWTDQISFTLDVSIPNVPITINIGFRAEEEGVFERKMRIYHVVGDEIYTLAEIFINAQAIGEDERYRTLLANFGLPDPKDFPKLFKEANINEDLPDWELVNQKSKHMILEHDKIMPFIGTYKALVNAIKWLGYEDIYIKEWFKNVKENKKLSLIIPYDAADRAQTILSFSPDERKTLKKLNQLSLNYCLTRETGQTDDWGTPLTENCYEYNLKEVLVKLMALKQWLENNIIGVNCRIIDLTGDGVYFERYKNLIYSTDNVGYDYKVQEPMTPKPLDKSSELVSGDASIRLTLLELVNKSIKNVQCSFGAMVDHLWDPSTGITYHSNDPAALLIDPTLKKFLKMGSLFSYPFRDLKDIQWKLSVEKPNAGVVGKELVTNPLFIYENEIKFYNTFDSSSIFYNASTNLNLLLEKAYFRDPSIDVWEDSIAWTLLPNASSNGYTLESSSGIVVLFDNYMNLRPGIGANLQYAVDTNYKVPLLTINNFVYRDTSSLVHYFSRDYHLDILDGKIIMNSNTNDQLFINFQYDTSLNEQMITLNAVYQSERMPLFIVDPSEYYWADPIGMSGGNSSTFLKSDNNVHTMYVNHIGDYNVELFGWDGFNTLFYNKTQDPYNVWIKYPTIYSLLDTSVNSVCVSTYMPMIDISTLLSSNTYPIYDRNIPLHGLTFQLDGNGKPYIKIPSITYFQDVPEPNSLNRFYNLTERVLTINGSTLTIDPDYQSFNTGDDINLVKFDKGKYELILEVGSHIINSTGTTLIVDNIPTNMRIDASSDVYILNNTWYLTLNASNNYSTNQSTIDISGYTFRTNQLVGIIATDMSIGGYSWGAAYRVISVDGSRHTLNNILPEQFINNTVKYPMRAKHAFSTYSSMTMNTEIASETNNMFNVYLNNSYCQEYYLDDTFVFVNVLFDQEKVNEQWYDASNNLVDDTFYYFDKPINVDSSTLVILKAQYDNSTYLLNHKNIWTINENISKNIILKVYNEIVPYVFNEIGDYDVTCESYDIYGNIQKKIYEGLIHVH